jgi:clan AA aspartic protease
VITGHVNSNPEAVVSLVVRGPDGQEKEIEAVIDTGFTGEITLPLDLITELGLPFIGQSRAVLGDGSEILYDMFEVSVIWSGGARLVNVDAAETEPLLGMDLLLDHELAIQVVPGGTVSIRPLLLS